MLENLCFVDPASKTCIVGSASMKLACFREGGLGVER